MTAKLIGLFALSFAATTFTIADTRAVAVPVAARLMVQGADIKYKPYELVRLKAEGVDPKAGIVWRVYPSAGVQKATTAKNILEFIAPPGIYHVEALVIKVGLDGAIDVDEQSVTVEIESCCDKVPPIPDPKKPDPKPPEKKKPDPLNALGRIQFGNAGCTATVIGPRRADGKWDVLTAAHCVTGVGVNAKGTMKMKDGRTLAVRVGSIHETPDCAWLVTEDAGLADLAFAEIAKENPLPGVAIWHAGYGIDKPGNREDGKVTVGENEDGQIEMSISVSSGDSGGGIFRDDTGELIGVVCCTTEKGARARVWGCSPVVARKHRPKSAHEDTWTPFEIPQREDVARRCGS